MSRRKRTEIIRTVSDLARSIEGKESSIYRGQENSSWELVPSVMRKNMIRAQSSHDRLNHEEEMLAHFKRQARPHLNPVPEDSNNWEWLALAQHYGLPTRFLDWTEHAAAALFFAVEKPNDGKDSAVWISGRPNEATAEEYHPLHINRICLYQPPHISPRITVQCACFTAHPTDYIGTRYDWPADLYKLEIPSEARVPIRDELRSLGIHRASLFPELEGISTEIKRRYSFMEDE